MADGVAGLVLAAGAGRRFGRPKALLRRGGSLFVEHAVDVLRSGGCAPVVVVLGAAAETVLERADLNGARTVHNEQWPTGMGSSLRLGLRRLNETPTEGTSAALILPVDMPGMTAAAVRRVAAHAAPDALAAACYGGERGHPVLLGRRHWDGVAERALGDRGARDYLRERTVTLVPCEDVASGEDVDRPADLDGG
ncbi:nucleotidyltransferase family protein [Actinopolyspora mortivallis]|uniref:Molybdopterin-guanine dinucleotide biosynthesis protein A n=1 Tax=Actinopolyspora mortivallis TaxID=33906 RepID=A0A2T0GUX8_ACTMO|nr:nucleotidyltransferase family protein [Actinopolyspora mortivallis]PRW62904.1 molybdopterin-guanine dinucleotide biosynthesis protein A [Actinopolyspora mortivallis]